MARRIDPKVGERVKELLATGLTRREIARQVGISKGTVRAMATGQWFKRPAKRPAKRRVEFKPPSGPLVWCSRCRANVQKPCVACGARRWKAGQNQK